MPSTHLDRHDRQLLAALQRDASLSLNDLADRVHLSRNAVWRRLQRLEAQGVIRERVAHLDRTQLNLSLSVFIAVRTAQHNVKWLEQFNRAVSALPEILGVYRMTGDVDYLLHAVCLLYTSPSPRDGLLSRMPSSA